MARARRGRGEGGIFQRADGYWVGTVSLGYTANGKRKRITKYGKTKREVQDKLQSLSKSPDAPKELAKVTVETYLMKWLDLTKPTVEHQTYRKYEEHVRIHIVPHIGTLKLTELKRFHLEDWYKVLADADVSAAMRVKIGRNFSAALNVAVSKEMIPANPMMHVAKPKAEKEEMTPLSSEQVGVFLEAARQDRLFSFYACAMDTGMRPGELFALQWPDVDFERSSVTVTKSLAAVADGSLKVKDTKTKSGRRQILLTPFTVDVLHEHRKRMLVEGFAGGPVFPSTTGGWLHLTNVHRHSFKPILRRAKLPDIRLYDLRHTCATLLLQAGENPKVVSERLGHATIVLTLETYAHVMPGMQAAAAGKMQGILSKAATG